MRLSDQSLYFRENLNDVDLDTEDDHMDNSAAELDAKIRLYFRKKNNYQELDTENEDVGNPAELDESQDDLSELETKIR